MYGDYYHLVASMKLDATPRALREAAEALLRPATAAPPRLRGSNGNVYAVSLNGTNNEANFLRVSLDSYTLWAGPPLPGVRNIGQCAIVSADGATFWTAAIVNTASGEGMFLVGIDTATGALTQLLNTSAWPGADGGHVLVEELFPAAGGGLMVVARVLRGAQLLLQWSGKPADMPMLLGAVNVSGGDLAYDAAGQRLFEVVPGQSDDDSGTLVTVTTGPGAPATSASIPLAAHFGFPQWLGSRKALVGLSLTVGGPNGYARNVTLLDPRTGATQDLGELGDTCVAPPLPPPPSAPPPLLHQPCRTSSPPRSYVVLEDGPKSLDAEGGRAFFMLASGPFAEFEVVSVDVSGSTAKVLERVGLCGFIGYCPESFAWGP